MTRGAVLRTVAFVGLLAGFAEVGMLAMLKWGAGRFIFVSRDAIWMAPLADMVYALLIPGLLLVALHPVLPGRLRRPLAAAVPALFGAYFVVSLVPSLADWAAWIIAIGVAVQTARVVGSRDTDFDRLVRRGVPLALGAVLALAIGLAGWRMIRERRILAAMGPAPQGAPNVLLLVLDTVRSMSMSLYGYERSTTPAIEAWSTRAVRFDKAIAAAPWTLTSHAVMFTGRYPQELSADYFAALDETYPTLATFLGERGWRTGGFVANANYCGWETGLQRGFSRYEDWPISVEQIVWSSALGRMLSRDRALRRKLGNYQKLARKPAAAVNAEFLGWLDQRPADRPFFAFINYFDAHQPYVPPAPFDTLWGSQHSEGYPRRVHQPTREHPEWRPEDAALARDDYDRSIAYLDQEIGRLLAELDRRGLTGNTIIILTADHGEEFAEHGAVEHGGTLYRQAVEVPLLIAGPADAPAGAIVPGPVSLRDIASTIADLAGFPNAPFPGRSLARWWRTPPGDPVAPDTIVSELSFAPNQPRWIPLSRGTMRSVIVDGVRYIRAGDGKEELFDFMKDPGETHDLAGDPSRAAAVASAREALDRIVASHPPVRALPHPSNDQP